MWIRTSIADCSRCRLQRDPASGSLAPTHELFPNRHWRKVALPLVAVESLQAGDAVLTFDLGAQQQTIELGGFELTNYGDLSLVKGDGASTFQFHGQTWATPSLVPVAGQWFQRAWHVDTPHDAAQPMERAARSELHTRAADGRGCDRLDLLLSQCGRWRVLDSASAGIGRAPLE